MTEPSPDSDDPAITAPKTLPILLKPPLRNAEEARRLIPSPSLTQEVDRWKDLAYRSQAELDNFRKRSAREAQETRAYANADLLRALFPIIDNFDMGLEAARAESEKSMIFMGMSMVQPPDRRISCVIAACRRSSRSAKPSTRTPRGRLAGSQRRALPKAPSFVSPAVVTSSRTACCAPPVSSFPAVLLA
jgi:hypothetical protein